MALTEYAFQDEGVDWLADGVPTKYLADEMGMGKSVEEIRAADRMGWDHIDVVCPAIAVEDWYRKFLEWSDGSRELYKSYNSRPVAQGGVPRRSVIISGFETATHHRKLFKGNKHRGLLLIDEAQYLMNPRTIRARALYGADCAGFGGISDNYDAVWVSSGTPTPNGDPRELWAHLHALRPYSILDPETGRPYSYTAFGDRFCFFRPGLGAVKCIGTRNEPELLKILGGGPRRFMLRRTGEVAGLPDVRFDIYPMKPTSVPRELDISRWPDLTDRLDRIVNSAANADIGTQFEEEIATLRRLTGLLKVEATCDLLSDELQRGQLDKVVIFAYHVDVVNEIAKRLSKFGGGAITGAVSEKRRWELIDGFQSGRFRFIAAQIIAASVNTSLGSCRHVFFAETDWVADNNRQAAFRCRRIDGHKQPVLARILSIVGTIDERIQAAASRKLRQSRLILPHSNS